MTTEEKAKAYDEALERAKNIKSKILQSHLSTESCKAVSEYINKIIPELRESEDERTRKNILALVKKHAVNHERCQMEAYLEKQKEQKPAEKLSKEEYVKKFKALCDLYEITLPNREYDIYHLCKDLHRLFGDADIQQPAEWREGDEKMRESAISFVQAVNSCRYILGVDKHDVINWLKSRRPQPQWKPSEEQMKVLLNAEGLVRANNYPENAKILASLYEQLKNL